MKIEKLLLYLLFALILPIAYILIRFKAFTVESVKISVWGLVIIGLIILIVGTMIKYYVSGMKTKFSMLKQVLDGVSKILLPLIIVLIIAIAIKSKQELFLRNLDKMIEALVVIIGCESIAIFINPIPKWAFENNVEGLAEITDKLLDRAKGDDK